MVTCLAISTSLTKASPFILSSWPRSMRTLELLGTLKTHRHFTFRKIGSDGIKLLLASVMVVILCTSMLGEGWIGFITQVTKAASIELLL